MGWVLSVYCDHIKTDIIYKTTMEQVGAVAIAFRFSIQKAQAGRTMWVRTYLNLYSKFQANPELYSLILKK